MTDPLSGTASVVTVLSFGLQVCKSLLDYYQSARQSRNDVAALCVSIENLRKILKDVEKILQQSHQLDSVTRVSESVQACRNGLNMLAKKVEKVHKKMSNPGMQSLRATLQYPFKESTIAKLK